MNEKDSTCEKYDLIAEWFDSSRGKAERLLESEYLDAMLPAIPPKGSVLDLGCGSGEPLAGYFIRHRFSVVGVDGAPKMIEMCKARFPEMTWIIGDMRSLDLDKRFDAVIAWDSFFHLNQAEQRAMFGVFFNHLKKGGMLLFTSGPTAGETSGMMQGYKFNYSSLAPDEYRRLLAEHGFKLILHKIEDPACGNHTVWLAQFTQSDWFIIQKTL